MSSARNPGRVAGYWYLLLVVLGPLRLIPNKLFVQGNAAATASNIAAHTTGSSDSACSAICSAPWS